MWLQEDVQQAHPHAGERHSVGEGLPLWADPSSPWLPWDTGSPSCALDQPSSPESWDPAAAAIFYFYLPVFLSEVFKQGRVSCGASRMSCGDFLTLNPVLYPASNREALLVSYSKATKLCDPGKYFILVYLCFFICKKGTITVLTRWTVVGTNEIYTKHSMPGSKQACSKWTLLLIIELQVISLLKKNDSELKEKSFQIDGALKAR